MDVGFIRQSDVDHAAQSATLERLGGVQQCECRRDVRRDPGAAVRLLKALKPRDHGVTHKNTKAMAKIAITPRTSAIVIWRRAERIWSRLFICIHLYLADIAKLSARWGGVK